MAADVTTSTLPSPAPQAVDAARAAAAAARQVPPKPEGSGRSFSDELSRQAAGAKDGSDTNAAVAAPVRREASPQAKEALAPLKKVALANKQDIDNSPVVALLTGHLERLTPAQIPALVSGNRFLGDALGDDDLAEFMSKPTTVGNLLKALDLSPAIAQQAQQLGLDLNQTVTPSDLLKTIGVDPQRVFAELTLLKANISMDGVASYVSRATVLGGKDAAKADVAAPDRLGFMGAVKTPGMPQLTGAGIVGGGLEPPTMPTVQPPPLPPSPGRPSLGGKGQADAPSLGSVDPSQLLAPALYAAPGPQTLVNPGLVQAAPVNGIAPVAPALLGGLELGRMDPRGMDVGALDPAHLAAALSGAGALDATLPDEARQGAADAVGKDDTPRVPAMNRATFDAYAELGDKLRSLATQRASFGGEAQVVPQELLKQGNALADQLMQGGFQVQAAAKGAGPTALPQQQQRVALGTESSPQDAATAAANAAPPVQAQTQATVQPAPLQASNVRPEASLSRLTGLSSNLAGAPFAKDGPQRSLSLVTPGATSAPQPQTQAAQPQPAPVDGGPYSAYDRQMAQLFPGPAVAGDRVVARSAVPIEELRLSTPLIGAKAVLGGDDDAPGQDDERREGSGKGDSRAAMADKARADLPGLRPTAHHAGSHGFAAQLGEGTALTSQQRVDLMQKVLDHATMLSKSGGGTVRLDLGSPELGPMEMAINLNKDRIDLRIVAGSERVRDAMMADLSGLKDALTSQNVRLGNVEVGVGQQQQRQHSNNNAFAGNGFAGNGQNGRGNGYATDGGQGGDRQPAPRPIQPLAPPLGRRPLMPATPALWERAGAGRIAVRA